MSKLLISKLVKSLSSSNIPFIVFTFLVSKLRKSNVFSSNIFLNIKSMFTTSPVFKVLTSKVSNLLRPLNIDLIFITFSVLSPDIFNLVIQVESSNILTVDVNFGVVQALKSNSTIPVV